MIDIKLVRERYASLLDQDITRIARTNAQGLEGAAIPLLVAEIEKRKLGNDLVEWITAERRLLSTEELFKLKEIVVNSLCPDCQKARGLIGVEYSTRTSFIVDTSVDEHRVIVCERCGKSRESGSFITTLVTGWWSVEGLFATPFTLLSKLVAFFTGDKFGEKIVERFIQENMGKITLSNDDPATIQDLLDSWNSGNDPIRPGTDF